MNCARHILRLLLPLLVAVLQGAPLAQGAPPARVEETLRARLARGCCLADSVLTLAQLYDVVAPTEREKAADAAIEAALKTGNSAIGLDILRSKANSHVMSDSLLALDFVTLERFPRSADRDFTHTFLQMQRDIGTARYATEAQQKVTLNRLLRHFYEFQHNPAEHPMSLFEQIETLNALCIYLSRFTHGDLLERYVKRLDALMSTLPPEAYYLRNAFLVQSSTSWRSAGNYDRSLEADRKLLSIIDSLDARKNGTFRTYRDYDVNRYIIYTRMLSCYDLLRHDEPDSLYAHTRRIAAQNERVRRTDSISRRPEIYYAMYRRDYPRALELLKAYIDVPYNRNVTPIMLEMLVEAARDQGDSQALADASSRYITILKERLEQGTQEKTRELEILYGLDQLRQENRQRQARDRNTIITVMIVVAVLLIALAVLLAILVKGQRRPRRPAPGDLQAKIAQESKRLGDELEKTKKDLAETREALHEKDITLRAISDAMLPPLEAITQSANLLIDSCEGSSVPSLFYQHTETLRLNLEILTSMVADAGELQGADSPGGLHLEPRDCQLRQLCQMALANVRHLLHPGVTLALDPDHSQPLMIFADPARLLQILNQLLTNAARYTTQGSITLGYTQEPASEKYPYGRVAITVADTGCGIDPADAGRIFEPYFRGSNNDPLSPPTIGIGLTLARLLANRMGGSLRLTDCGQNPGEGARFTLSLPLK